MKDFLYSFCVFVLIISNYIFAQFEPPKTKFIKTIDTLLGYEIVDSYRWLENKEDPEVKEWSKAQHQFTLDYIKTTTKEVAGLEEEIRKYLDRDYISPPFFKSNREFFYKRKKGEQQNKLYTRVNGKEILLFDPISIDPSGKTAISTLVLSRKADKAAICVQTRGNEISKCYFIDTKKGKEIAPPLDNVYNISWCRNENFVYVTYRSEEDIILQKPLKTYRHRLGSPASQNEFLLSPKDAKDFASIYDDEDSDFTIISEGDFYTNTLKIKRTNSNDTPKVIFSSKLYRTSVRFYKDRLYYFTNYEAPNFKLLMTSINKPDFHSAKTIISEMNYPIESFEITSDYLILNIKKDVMSKLYVYDLDGNFIQDLPLPDFGNIGSMNYHKESNTVYVSLMTFTAPSKIYKLDGKTLKWTLFYQDESPLNTSEIEAEQVFYNSKDGTRIPMFIIHKRGIKLDRNNPTLLYGYGGFNISMSPHYLGLTTSFINRGGIYAVACLRGGSEYGENWHKQGMLHNKQNVFDDFISAAEYLIQNGYTSPNRLAIKGGSNGGLLVGAVATQRPDLFKAVVCAVPLLDMIRFHKFLIARYWIAEYGDPDQEDDFRYLLSYSPYHNIRAGISLPTMLIKAGENDTRVDPSHAKKFAALLQNSPWQTNPILLFIDFESGHGSGQSIEQQIFNTKIEWQWLMSQLGME
ncbi:MAG: prolyl oligopeptidase family serine peptidase [Candidatus Kapaibacteriales bacterium]